MSDKYSRKRGTVCPLSQSISQRNGLRARRAMNDEVSTQRLEGARKVCSTHARVPLSVSTRPSEAMAGIELSLSFFNSIRRPYAGYSEVFPVSSRGGGTSLDQAMLTKTLRPCDIGAGLCVCEWAEVTLDFTQKPGEGETLMVTLEAMKRPDRPSPPFFHRHDGRGNAKRTVRVPFSFQA